MPKIDFESLTAGETLEAVKEGLSQLTLDAVQEALKTSLSPSDYEELADRMTDEIAEGAAKDEE